MDGNSSENHSCQAAPKTARTLKHLSYSTCSEYCTTLKTGVHMNLCHVLMYGMESLDSSNLQKNCVSFGQVTEAKPIDSFFTFIAFYSSKNWRC